VTYLYPTPDSADDPSTTSHRRGGYPIDNRDTVIGPLPKTAPPVLGAGPRAIRDPTRGLEIIRGAVDGA
jgi:hypothetical protein